MTAPAKDRLAALLSLATAGGAPSAQRSLPAESLRLEVRGLGPVDLPVTSAQAQELAAVARPAMYGRGSETLFDPLVRDTGEVPKSRVKVDRRHWDRALNPVLDGLRDDLGLPPGTRLTAELHSMLVYGPGQFFKPHLDSEKADGMVGSLVVTLPSEFRGGALVVEHGDHRATYRGPRKNLSCVAFYADCRHEIRPVISGHRIVLTYDLVIAGDPAGAVAPPGTSRDLDRVEVLAACIDEHFSTAPTPRWRNDRRSSAPPTRLVFLLDWDLTLGHWVDAAGGAAEPIGSRVHDDEVATSTPTRALEAYESEYQPYMGNWGNTMDRWYRRAAVVVWPWSLDFAVRAEASPAWALEVLSADEGSVSADEQRDRAASLAPFWSDVVPTEPSPGYVTALLRVALVVDDPDLATMLLDPHLVEDLGPDHASAGVALADRYGSTWTAAWVQRWVREPSRWSERDGRRLAWLAVAGALIEALNAEGPSGRAVANTVVGEVWSWAEGIIDRRRRVTPPSARDRGLAELAAPILGALEAVVVVDYALAAVATASLSGGVGNDDVLVPLLIGVLREAERRPGGSALAATLDPLAAHRRRRLEARLERQRDADDWSISFNGGCGCADCRTLSGFLEDPAEQRRERPLAKRRRQHVHQALDARELPVRHQTRRTGRPYTLVLTKTEALFERDAEERRQAAADLEWLDSRRT